ncbi:uncharacterized protein LOC101456993 [Ceratitis capitata]|uniref:(Mediterranean fruit fly) hypothetical protein n=1 Tax=Ceratitis capitata TaxID=7213 RepID=W8BNV7_CERCA|nr:uncharacterized protein LOC101456993 [Ceratitis capitata]CAD6999676.1 unnamed protein product [Ceratitis capitata]
MEVDSDSEQATTSRSAVNARTERMRARNRVVSQQYRVQHRAKTCDSVRVGLGEEIENVKVVGTDVESLITRIKRRKHASTDELCKLAQAFQHNEANIAIFGRADGVFPVIVKELTSIDTGNQIAAMECLCNLSLGEAPVCEKIIKFAGSYLVTYLDNPNENIKRLCLWIISNIVFTSNEATRRIIEMGAVPKLWNIYVDGECVVNELENFAEDAACCLQLILLNKEQKLRCEDLLHINENMSKKHRATAGAEYYLLFIFHSEIVNPNSDLSTEQRVNLLRFVCYNLCRYDEFESINSRLRVLYAVRILSNYVVCVTDGLREVITLLKSPLFETTLEKIVNKFFSFNEHLLSVELIFLLRHLIHEKVEQSLLIKMYQLEIPIFNYVKLLRKS